jgi:hypothetical protein
MRSVRRLHNGIVRPYANHVMDKELVKLLEKLCDLPDNDLIHIVNFKPADYRPEVITFARVIMARRGFTVNKNGNIMNNRKNKAQTRNARQSQPDNLSIESEEKQSPEHIELNRGLIVIQCPRCNARLEYAGTRRLHEDKSLSVLVELGEMYKKGASEFLDVYICSKCGRAELFVDGIGEDLRPQ